MRGTYIDQDASDCIGESKEADSDGSDSELFDGENAIVLCQMLNLIDKLVEIPMLECWNEDLFQKQIG